MIYSYIITDDKDDIEYIERVLTLPESILIIDYTQYKEKKDSFKFNPKLLLGAKKVKEVIPNVNYFTNRIDPKTYWGESKNEELNEFRKNIELFIKNYFNYIISDISYYNTITPFHNIEFDFSYENNRGIYFLRNNKILGLDKYFIKYTENDFLNNKLFEYKSKCNKSLIDNNNKILQKYKKLFFNNSEIIEKYIVHLEYDRC